MDEKQIEITGKLSRAFAKATKDMGRAVRGTDLYRWQMDFTYLLDEVARGPTSEMMKAVSACNQYIDGVMDARKKTAV